MDRHPPHFIFTSARAFLSAAPRYTFRFDPLWPGLVGTTTLEDLGFFFVGRKWINREEGGVGFWFMLSIYVKVKLRSGEREVYSILVITC